MGNRRMDWRDKVSPELWLAIKIGLLLIVFAVFIFLKLVGRD